VEFLVHLGVPFSQAHTAVGKLIRFAEDKKIKIREMSDKELRKFDQHLSQLNIKKIMNPEYAVASKKSLPAQKYSTSKRSPRSK
ncbi:MAG: hypothetical protein KKH93_02510, partial [Candidatus Omnitrophica bacterium]|nr:hypothetical protein [Candidatus Omnitrophota bacterium]